MHVGECCFEQVQALQQKVDDLSRHTESAAAALETLATCPYERDTIAAAVAALQRTVDDMSLARYSNLPQWTRTLDAQVLLVYACIKDIYSMRCSQCEQAS
jgi:hypothetical protein